MNLIVASLIALLFVMSGCKVSSKAEPSYDKIYGMSPFAPSGGYELGSIIIVKDGLPELSTGVNWLNGIGKFKLQSDPQLLPARRQEQKSLLKANLNAASNKDQISSQANVELLSIQSFKLDMDKARRQYLVDGRTGIIAWLYSIDLQNPDAHLALQTIYDTYPGEKKYLISEVIEVSGAKYAAEWGSGLSSEAKTEFANLFSGQGSVSWRNDGLAEIIVDSQTPILVAYKSFELPLDKIKEALISKSWGI